MDLSENRSDDRFKIFLRIFAKLFLYLKNFNRFSTGFDMGAILLKNIKVAGRGDDEVDILIDGGLIMKITPAAQHAEETGAGGCTAPDGAEVVDGKGKVAVPGFVNMHTHAAMSLMRGMGEDVVFHDWLKKIWEMESHVDAEYVYWGTKVACIEMAKTGTTTFFDHYWFLPSAMKAAEEAGVRPVLSYVMLDKFDRQAAMRQRSECEDIYRQSLDWGWGKFAVGIHSIYSVSRETILWTADFARSHGLKIHIHLCETEREVRDCIREHGVTPVRYAEDLGLLGPDVVAAHTLWLTPEDTGILGKRKVSCVHNINSNLKLASGYRFPYSELKEAGANVCIGTDGCASSNNLDILEAMKTAAMVQKAWRGDPTAMPLDELMAMATSNGADALGTGAGRIEEGRTADLMIVDTDSTFFLSPGSFLANFIYSAHSDCIDSVICGGRFIMRGRRIPGEEEVIRGAREVLSRVKLM